MTVTVKIPLHRTDVYHPKQCQNVRMMRSCREVTQTQAEHWGLRKCKACTDQFGGAKNQSTRAYRLVTDNDSIEELHEAINASD